MATLTLCRPKESKSTKWSGWRIKVPAIKRSDQRARQVEAILTSLDGIIRVTANPTTGNVLVLFHSHLVTHQAIIDMLRQTDHLRKPTTVPAPRLTERLTGGMVDTVSHAIGRSIAEAFAKAVIERGLLALL